MFKTKIIANPDPNTNTPRRIHYLLYVNFIFFKARIRKRPEKSPTLIFFQQEIKIREQNNKKSKRTDISI